jgi:hypothetical protein
MAAGLGSTWWQYLLLFIAVAASWAGVPLIGTAALGAAAVAASVLVSSQTGRPTILRHHPELSRRVSPRTSSW